MSLGALSLVCLCVAHKVFVDFLEVLAKVLTSQVGGWLGCFRVIEDGQSLLLALALAIRVILCTWPIRHRKVGRLVGVSVPAQLLSNAQLLRRWSGNLLDWVRLD